MRGSVRQARGRGLCRGQGSVVGRGPWWSCQALLPRAWRVPLCTPPSPQYAGTTCCPRYAGTPCWPRCAGTTCWPRYAGTTCWPRCAGTTCWPRYAGTTCWPRYAGTTCSTAFVLTPHTHTALAAAGWTSPAAAAAATQEGSNHASCTHCPNPGLKTSCTHCPNPGLKTTAHALCFAALWTPRT